MNIMKLWGESILNKVSLAIMGVAFTLIGIGWWLAHSHIHTILSLSLIGLGIYLLVSDWRKLSVDPKTLGLVTIMGKRARTLVRGNVLLCKTFAIDIVEISVEQREIELKLEDIMSWDRVSLSGKVVLGYTLIEGTLETYLDRGKDGAIKEQLEGMIPNLMQTIASSAGWRSIEGNTEIATQGGGTSSISQLLKNWIIHTLDANGGRIIEITFVNVDLNSPPAVTDAAEEVVIATLETEALRVNAAGDVAAAAEIIRVAKEHGLREPSLNEAMSMVMNARTAMRATTTVNIGSTATGDGQQTVPFVNANGNGNQNNRRNRRRNP